MKPMRFVLGSLFCLSSLTLCTSRLLAQSAPPLPMPGPTGGNSPYFFVQGDPGVEAFPLLKTALKAEICGVIASATLTQTYKNEGKTTIEAIYVFPLGTKSAINAMRMRIGNRVIEAQIEKKAQAEKIYEKAKSEGRVASLLEQERPNVFQMKVANIMPGDVVEVEVAYTELLVPEAGIYEFVFPAVVGPRYTAGKGGGASPATAAPYLHQGEKAPYGFELSLHLAAGMTLSRIESPSHRVEIKRPASDEADVALSPEESAGGNRDFILRYSLAGGAIQTGLLLYPGAEEKFFLLMLEPPAKFNPAMIPPREYVFIVDISGSMQGFPLDVSRSLITRLIEGLKPEDYLNVLFFAGGSEVLSPRPLLATAENKKKALKMLMRAEAGGGTEILPALRTAVSLPKPNGLSRVVVISTDGYVDVEKQVFDLIREKLGQANVFAFGIGSGVNRFIIEGIARAGRGEPFVVGDEKEAPAAAEKFVRYVESPLLTDITLTVDGFDAYDLEPPSLPDLFAERPLVLCGKYRNASGRIGIKGKIVGGEYAQDVAVSPSAEDTNAEPLKYLWAREKIARLADYGRAGGATEAEVTALGLKYHLMTDYTAFVAVDTIVRETGETVTVKQPLPLPQGVNDSALPAGRGVLALAPGDSATTSLRFAKRDEAKPPAPGIALTGAKLPAGLTLGQAAEIVEKQAKEELKKIFAASATTSLTVSLKVEKGKVTEAAILKCDGKPAPAKDLEAVFQKLVFPDGIVGTVELTLELI
ncbi:MAG: VIT domain-containing protein [Candidatus Aureabacteria bacterium]|nr:VIT domain-containing protein [Candidatus Auribacterota bacterium]